MCYVFCVAGVGAAPGAPRRDHRDCAACDSVTTPQQGGDILQHLPMQQYTYFQTRAGLAISNASLTLNDINTQEWIYRLPGTAGFFYPTLISRRGFIGHWGQLAVTYTPGLNWAFLGISFSQSEESLTTDESKSPNLSLVQTNRRR